MTFWEFLPNLAMIVLTFTILAASTTGVLKMMEVLVRSIAKRLGIQIDFGIIYTWSFMVVLSVVMVKFLKLWTDSFISVPYLYWKIFRYLILILILSGASALAWKLRERFAASVIERLTPVFWLFFLISVVSVPVVFYHGFKMRANDFPAPVEASTVSSVSSSKPNIILVTMDALTARDMSLYGYERKTTPFLEEFARESHLFTRFHSNSNFTTPSVVSMLTSRHLWSHQTYHLTDNIREDIRSETFVRVLRENGYTTMAFVANRVANPFQLGIARDFDIVIPTYKLQTPHSISTYIGIFTSRVLDHRYEISWWWLNFYIDRIFSMEDTTISEFPIRLTFDSFFDHLSEVREPFFAWIHLMPPHFPYLPPKPYKNTFAGKTEMSSIKTQMGYLGPYPPSKQKEINSLRKRYDEFVLYCDAEFRYFVNQLKEMGLYDNSLLIFSSDHGEMFEKGYFEHRGPFLYEPLVHIPMIIHEPGQTRGTQIDTLGEQIDIAPTLIDYLGLPIPEWMDGESLLTALKGGTSSAGPKFSMWFEMNRSMNHPITTGTVAVFEGDYKLIHYIKDGRSELYNLRLDPKEEKDLIEMETHVAERLESIILERIRDINATRKG
jgi:arylsulfatase A-like enzyme